jgi:hypothetical protein
MGEYRIDDSFEMIGAFWRFGQRDDSFTGTLTSRKGRVEILTSPSYTAKLDENAVRDAFKFINNDRDLQRIPSLCGFTSGDRCTLLNSLTLDGGGNTNFPTGQKISATRHIAARAVMGLHVESAAAKSIDGGAFYFTKVHQLLPTPWTSQMGAENTSYSVPRKAREVFKFLCSDIDAEVICEIFAGGGVKVRKRASIKSVPRIRINPKNPQSVDWYTAIAFRAENFFTLFLGTSVSIKRIQLFQGDDDGWVVQKTGCGA